VSLLQPRKTLTHYPSLLTRKHKLNYNKRKTKPQTLPSPKRSPIHKRPPLASRLVCHTTQSPNGGPGRQPFQTAWLTQERALAAEPCALARAPGTSIMFSCGLGKARERQPRLIRDIQEG
jgi:hypothetical protein